MQRAEEGESAEQQTKKLINESGKMRYLHAMLPTLRKENRKILIFSQFKLMLNVL